MMRRTLLCGMLALAALAGCAMQEKPLPQGLQRISLVSPSGERIVLDVETATTPDAWALGLMERTELTGDGMLFAFPDDAPRAFWMKNTLIALDIFYFDSGGRFVSRETMTPCAADPCPTYVSAGPVRYALEVAAGRGDALGIGTGWKAEW